MRKITSLPARLPPDDRGAAKVCRTLLSKREPDIVTVHAEACKERLKDTLMLIKNAGAKCGAVINPDTPVSAISEVLPLSDMVLVMSVFPGFGGQKFIPEVLEKVRELRSLAEENGWNFDIEIDGGISPSNAAEVKSAGATCWWRGAPYLRRPTTAAIEALRKKLK